MVSIVHALLSIMWAHASANARGSLRSLNAPTQVQSFNCTKHPGPLQTLRIGQGKGFRVVEKTIEGNITVFDIPFERTTPKFLELNGCGINPIDNIVYCVIWYTVGSAEDSYLVRVDANTVEFVAKSPTFSWSGAFSSSGIFYFGADSRYFQIEDAHKLVGYTEKSASGLKDYSSLSPFLEFGFGADIVVAENLSFEGKTQAHYVMTMTSDSPGGGALRVFRKAKGGYKKWVLMCKPPLPSNLRSAQAAWNYQNRVFFSFKDGGIYEIILSSIDLKQGTVVVERVGPSLPVMSTDGMNCPNVDIPTKWAGRCGPSVGAYNAFMGNEPVPQSGAVNIQPDQELMFWPSHDVEVTGYQVFLGPTSGSMTPIEWHLACNLPCGVNVCKPPFGLDNTLGGQFAWRVDHVKKDGSIVTGTVWYFSLAPTVTYDTIAVGDTYIDKKDVNYADKRHMLMRGLESKTMSPQFGFIKFDVPPATHAAWEDFDEFTMTSAAGKHPGEAYPYIFNNSVPIKTEMGPVKPKKAFVIDVTTSLTDAFQSGKKRIGFGLASTTMVSRICSQSRSNPRRVEGYTCYPELKVVLSVGSCPAVARNPSCSKPVGSVSGPLDAICGSSAPNFPTTAITDWRKDSAITTTTTTTTTTSASPIKDGHCRYKDHVHCPWPHSNIMCSGDQCCPDGSTCPSSQFTQAKGCNLKKYDCTAFVPINFTCRESEAVHCPGTDITCSGDTCCPNNSTCPSASVTQAEGCGPKMADCQALLSEDSTCAIGEFVQCPGSADKCFGNQCCPDGSTCPSAPLAIAPGCSAKKATCELLAWDVKLRVASVVFAKVDSDTKADVSEVAKAAYAHAASVPPGNVGINLTTGSLIVNAKISAPGGWSQKKLDLSVKSGVISEEMRLRMEALLSDMEGLKEASNGEMVFEEIKAQRTDEMVEAGSSSSSPLPSIASSSQAPDSDPTSTTFLGTATTQSTPTPTGLEASQGTPVSLHPAFLATFFVMGSLCLQLL